MPPDTVLPTLRRRVLLFSLVSTMALNFFLLLLSSPQERLIEGNYMLQVCAKQYIRDRGDHFKVVGLKTLANIKKRSGRCFAIYLALAPHLIYHLNEYNINVHTCYTIQYSQYVK